METQITNVLRDIGHLHSGFLHYLPRPSEPVELKRFTRVIDSKHLQGFDAIDILPTEELGETTFSSQVLQQYEEEYLKRTREDLKSFFARYNPEKISELPANEYQKKVGHEAHITVPRIDTGNPCRWPTIVHEMAHHLPFDELIRKFEKYRETIGGDRVVLLLESAKCDQVERWLEELWCDLFAALALGPAFWFSQWSAFLFTDAEYPVTQREFMDGYPPAILRLYLIERLLRHRHPALMRLKSVEDLIAEQYSVIEFIAAGRDDPQLLSDRSIIDAANLLGTFFVEEVFKKADDVDIAESLADDVEALLKQVKPTSEKELDGLISRLSRGIPIPGVPKGDADDVIEEPANLPEILLAAWVVRNTELFQRLCATANSGDAAEGSPASSLKDHTSLELANSEFSRFDSAVLRSIQVSEWFTLLRSAPNPAARAALAPTNRGASATGTFSNNLLGNSVLVDHQIKKALGDKEILVVPIMCLDEQLGSASLDVRLGTSFEIYHRNKYGIIDFVDPKNREQAASESEIVDLDILDSISLTPGQFVLAHTMEYIELSDNIAAEIEGRSSFARLGVEVHMTAGFIDPGFSGAITLEIHNSGAMPIILYPGLRIAQLRFARVSAPEKSYSRRHNSKYKGLLAQNPSRYSRDYEIEVLREAIHRRQTVFSKEER
ncbi:dCTP deaminase [Thiohalocapsa halophila]|uniref:dCTP deaminase n=1 Tax=Thiohalocapsa halophila TaxID=69359 RepID=UPI0019044AF3|nr:dCTP deaminase [Thiohalocapsa halophila]